MDFLGYKAVPSPSVNVKQWFCPKGSILEDEIRGRLVVATKLQFQDNWNWLMPVVEKCLLIIQEELKDGYKEEWNEWGISITDELRSVNKEYIYKEITQFLEWYKEK